MPRGPVNVRRGLRDGELSTRYRRVREAVPDDMVYESDWYDDCWDQEYDGHWDPWREASPLDFTIEKLWHGLSESPTNAAAGAVAQGPRDWSGDELEVALAEHMRRITSVACTLSVARQLDVPRTQLRDAIARVPALATWIATHRGPTSMLVLLAPFWTRPLERWVPDDERELGRSLIEHLFGRYRIPEVLFLPWTDEELPGVKWATWLVIIGGGGSLRRAASRFGWQISTKLVHHLFDAPAGVEPLEAIMWAELAQRGGTETELRRLRRHPAFVFDTTSMTTNPNTGANAQPDATERPERYRAFWIATVDWMISHRESLTDEMCQPILDWAMHRFTEDLVRATPLRERFTWSGRTPPAAREAARVYAEQIALSQYGYGSDLQWTSRGWDWKSEDGVWTIRELCNSQELAVESVAMNHCVGGYAHRCVAGSSVIFSAMERGERAFTVELEPGTRGVVQARGMSNRACTAQELEVVRRWLIATAPPAPAPS